MSYLRNKNEEAAYRSVYYPDTGIYLNMLGIQDRVELEKRERQIVADRAEEGFPQKATFKTYTGFKAIHHHLFQDLYSWAGKQRKYTTGRGTIPFAVPTHISPWMQKQFRLLAKERYLVNLSKKEFSSSAAEFVNEINACHPFIDGNGRAQRFWLRMLANNAGYDLILKSSDAVIWNDASRAGFVQSDHKPMAKLIEMRLDHLHHKPMNKIRKRPIDPRPA